MSRKCALTGKAPQVGHRVSHAQNKTKRRFYVNIRERRFWLASQKRWVRVKVSAAAIREIDKKGFDAVYDKLCAAKAC